MVTTTESRVLESLDRFTSLWCETYRFILWERNREIAKYSPNLELWPTEPPASNISLDGAAVDLDDLCRFLRREVLGHKMLPGVPGFIWSGTIYDPKIHDPRQGGFGASLVALRDGRLLHPVDTIEPRDISSGVLRDELKWVRENPFSEEKCKRFYIEPARCWWERVNQGLEECRGVIEEKYGCGDRPKWDDGKRTLSVGGEIVKQYRRQAALNQTAILREFERHNWSKSIESPLNGTVDGKLTT